MKKLALLAVSLLLVNCSKNDEEGSKEKSGYLVDSPVENLGYRTATHSGRTDAQGKYLYEEGETVTFFICDLEFPPVPATGYITPFDMAGTTDVTNSTVINIATFLQTLDQDGNADNGIFIPEVLHNCSNNIVAPVNFGSSTAAFAADPVVTNTVENSGSQNTELLDPNACMDHLLEHVYATAKYFEVYGTQAGNFNLENKGTLLGTSASTPGILTGGHLVFEFNVSGYQRFVLYVPSTSQKIYLDAVLFDDSHWLDSWDHTELSHRSMNFNPSNPSCAWNSPSTSCPYGGPYYDGFVEDEADNITINSTPGVGSYYGYSTRKAEGGGTSFGNYPLASYMKLYIKL